MILLILFLTSCIGGVAYDTIKTHKAAKDVGEVCYSIKEPEDIAGDYCLKSCNNNCK